MQTWKDMNPHCLHQLWNDTEIAELARLKSPEVIWPIWGGLSPVERADVFRYLVLYERGGYYADLDVECTTPIAKYPAGPFSEARGGSVQVPKDANMIVGYEFGHRINEQGRIERLGGKVERPEATFLG